MSLDNAGVETVNTANRVLVVTRVFDAPRELVFKAFTKPEHIARWWGPTGFTLPFCEMDFKVGGKYKYCMRSPEGEDHWVWGEYKEIVPPEKLAFTWDREDLEGNTRSRSVVTLTFDEYKGKTLFKLEQGIFEFQDDCDEHAGGWQQAFDRLAAFVASAASETDD